MLLTVADGKINHDTDKVILPQELLDTILHRFSAEPPYPLTFKLSANGRTTHVGVLEFSAVSGTIILPNVVRENLFVKDGMTIQVDLHELPKGEAATFKPLSVYDLRADWKTALESSFRSSYTTLTKGDVIRLKSGLKFLVENLSPADAVCIVDCDLEVDLVPLNEEQAQLVQHSDSQFSTLQLDTPTQGSANGHYTIQAWDRSRTLIIRLESTSPDAALLIGRDAATLSMHELSNLSSHRGKTLRIHANNDLITSRELHISVQCSEPHQYSVIISQTEEPSVAGEQCQNCLALVPARSMVLHERHCLRNNRRCAHPSCMHVYKKGSDETHWHCDICSDGGEGSKEEHVAWMHQGQLCECGASFPNIPVVAHHRATECPERLIECRFCHLILPQGEGEISYHDASMGYTAHETECGSRTVECESCRRFVKLKDVLTHARIHDAQRLNHIVPMICKNQNCVNSVHTPGLCKECFGPLYNTQDDPSGVKLLGRIKRRYAAQLVTGCKQDHCRNVMCATATGKSISYTDALKKVASVAEGKHFFCVNASVQRKRDMAEQLECEGEYEIAWCCRAVEATDDISNARGWLGREAIRRNETHS